ncbi:MAG: right-handed parallel beta-helix repeat-containing protein, partial [Acidobacteriota bacterium]|nr:right-handed parallel beta-helix repeat-containing protein [Acidobacteriota bacterium]
VLTDGYAIADTGTQVGIQLFDAAKNYIGNLPYTTGSAPFGMANAVLPGTQTYIRISFKPEEGTSQGPAPATVMFMAGQAASLPTMSIASPHVPFYGNSKVNWAIKTTVKKASELGCALGIDILTGDIIARNIDRSTTMYLIDDTAILNAFLATATATNPIKLILDGAAYVSGLILSPAGNTTIEGIGPGSGIYLTGASDGIRIGPWSQSISQNSGNSEGPFNGTPAPARVATNITLRNFTISPNPTTIGHPTYGVILQSASHITLDGLNIPSSCPYYAVALSNVGDVSVTNCSFTSGGTLHDGVHIDGPAEKIRIIGCYFATGDDGIALNAYEGYGGNISDVVIDSCIFNNALSLMRAYGSNSVNSLNTWNTNKITRVTVSNCVGSVRSCVASLGLGAGACNNENLDEIQDISFSNCDIAHTEAYSPFLVTCNVRSLTIHNHTHRPLVATAFLDVSAKYVQHVLVNNLTVVRSDAYPAAIPIVRIAGVPGGNMSKLTLRGITVVDQTGSAYAAMPYVLGAVTPLGELMIDAVDMDKFTALFDSNGTTNITTIKGVGVLGTATQIADATMGNGALYLSSDASGAPSIKVGGTVKRLTLA